MSTSPHPVFDGLLVAEGLRDVDLETLRTFGVEAALVTVAGTPVSDAREALARFEDLLAVHLPRFQQAGIRAWAALGLSGQGLPARGLHEILQALPGLCVGGRAAALGPLRLSAGEGEAAQEAFEEQLALAKTLELPVVVRAESGEALGHAVERLQSSGLPTRRILVTGLDEAGARVTLGLGFHAGLSLHPGIQRTEQALAAVRRLGARRVVLGSHAGLGGGGDLLALPRAVHRMAQEGLSEALISRVGRENLAAFLRVSGV